MRRLWRLSSRKPPTRVCKPPALLEALRALCSLECAQLLGGPLSSAEGRRGGQAAGPRCGAAPAECSTGCRPWCARAATLLLWPALVLRTASWPAVHALRCDWGPL
eukprot:10993289-Alexandrium_andersonii.AAC.1